MEVLAESFVGSGAQVVFLLGLALVIIILLVRSKRYFRQVTNYQVPAARPPRKSQPPKAISTPASDFEKWEVEMHDLARDLMGQLDSKIRVLELLIRQADEATERLKAARAVTGVRGEGQGAIEETIPPERSRPRESEHLRRVARDVIEPERSSNSPPSRKEPAHSESRSAARNASESRKPLKMANNPRFERVYALADAGMSAPTIANQIGTQVGEVELILSLRGKQSE
jgi:hypothetical protein